MTSTSTRIKHLTTVAGRIGWHGLSTDDYRETGDYLVGGTDLVNGDVSWSGCNRVDPEVWERDARIQLRDGDLLVTKDGTIGKVALVRDMPGRATLNSGVFRIRPSGSLDGRFLFWVFSSALFGRFIELLGQGSTINHLYQQDIVNFGIPYVDIGRQRAIAEYLDAKTARVDALIAKKQRMIELLQQRESHAFGERMRAEGLELPASLSDAVSLPNGWLHVKLSTALRQLTNGYVGPTRDILVDDGVQYIQGLHLKGYKIDFDRRPFFVSEDWHLARPRTSLRPGDVLIVQTGDIGRVAVVPDGFPRSNCHALLIARPNSALVLPDFLGVQLQSPFGYQSLVRVATGALHPHLEFGIRDVRIFLPPLDVQRRVVQAVLAEREHARRVTIALAGRLDLLRERRQALITAALTGEISIPEVAA